MNSLHYLYAAYIATWAIHGGYLVDVGPATYIDACSLADLRQLSGVATILYRQPDRGTGSRARRLRRARRPTGLFLDLVFPHTTSIAGNRKRRITRSAYGASAPHKLGSVFVFSMAYVVDAISA